MSLRASFYELLEDDERTTSVARIVRVVLVALIVLSIAASILETEPIFRGRLDRLFGLIEYGCVAIFSLEYVARVWVSIDDRAGRYSHPLVGRLRYMLTPSAIVDLVAVLPFYLSLFIPIDLIFLRLFRLLRILKITRYSPALATLQLVLYNERRSLLSALLVFGVVLVIAAGLMHAAEGEAQPERFGTIPAAMWWAVITLTTVGYGDATPITSAGKAIAALTALCGIGALALPTAILGAGFARELQKQDFVARSSMVGRVALFQGLGPAQLAEVTSLLHPRMLPPRYTVIRRGEHPEAMYFIDHGRVVMRIGERRITLGPGGFFGELALLEGRPREVTVTTLSPCRLLELDAGDFHRLIGGDAQLRETILAEARQRAELHGHPLHVGGSTEEHGVHPARADEP